MNIKQPFQLMQTVNQTVQFNHLLETYATEGVAYLTPDSLMAYCQSRLEGIDTQVNTAFAKQKQANYESSVLSSMLNSPAFALPSTTLTGQDAITKRQDVIAAIVDAEKKLPANDPLLSKLEDLKTSVQQMTGDLDANKFNTNICDGVQNIQKDLNSSAELSMINLQSLMSQRQSAIQMCTNLVQSLGDQMNKIAQNIGH
jgi:hypothetical protein